MKNSDDSLKKRIQNDMHSALRNKESLRLSTLRLLKATINQREIDSQTTLNNKDILQVISKMMQQRQDSAEQFTQANRPELADKEHQEIDILMAYLPKQLSSNEINAAIQTVINELDATSMKDMGKVMKALQSTLEGQINTRAISAAVKAILSKQ